jgi:hypothetical protein
MPTHDFTDIGDVLNYELLKGIITAIDSATDTCMVNVGGVVVPALLFYHCEPDSIARENGAIEGASGGFSVDDEVIVLVNNDKSVIKVIGHTDGIRHCGNPIVFTISLLRWQENPPRDQLGYPYLKKSVFVWDPQSNRLKKALVDYDDDAFQAWYELQEQVEDQSSLFSTPRTLCGKDVTGLLETRPSGCPELIPEMVDTFYNRDSAVIVGVGADDEDMYQRVYDNGYDIKAYGDASIELYESIRYPLSFFHTILLPDSPVSKVGFRIRKEFQVNGSTIEDIYHLITGSIVVNLLKDTFYGPLGEIGSFVGRKSQTYVHYYPDLYGSYIYEDYHIPAYEEGAIEGSGGIKYFSSFLTGIYTGKIIVNACVVQLLGLLKQVSLMDNAILYDVETVDPNRTIFVSAQALHVPQGTAGYDWVTRGRNTALETQIIAAINLAYSLNEIPANEIRTCRIGIKIIR